MENTISINLDPIKDGITGQVETAESTAGRYVVMGTNFDHRIISDREFWDYIRQIDEAGNLVPMVLSDYLIFFDRSKVVSVSGEDYLVGSFILVNLTDENNLFARMDEDDMEGVKEDICGYFTELIINGERVEALEVE